MLIILEKLLISFVIVYSIYMIYFYFRNKSKKKKNSLIEVQYLKRIYNINSIIITIDLFIYFNFNSVTLSLVVIFFVTFVLIAIFYTILGNIYRKYR